MLQPPPLPPYSRLPTRLGLTSRHSYSQHPATHSSRLQQQRLSVAARGGTPCCASILGRCPAPATARHTHTPSASSTSLPAPKCSSGGHPQPRSPCLSMRCSSSDSDHSDAPSCVPDPRPTPLEALVRSPARTRRLARRLAAAQKWTLEQASAGIHTPTSSDELALGSSDDSENDSCRGSRSSDGRKRRRTTGVDSENDSDSGSGSGFSSLRTDLDSALSAAWRDQSRDGSSGGGSSSVPIRALICSSLASSDVASTSEAGSSDHAEGSDVPETCHDTSQISSSSSSSSSSSLNTSTGLLPQLTPRSSLRTVPKQHDSSRSPLHPLSSPADIHPPPHHPEHPDPAPPLDTATPAQPPPPAPSSGTSPFPASHTVTPARPSAADSNGSSDGSSDVTPAASQSRRWSDPSNPFRLSDENINDSVPPKVSTTDSDGSSSPATLTPWQASSMGELLSLLTDNHRTTTPTELDPRSLATASASHAAPLIARSTSSAQQALARQYPQLGAGSVVHDAIQNLISTIQYGVVDLDGRAVFREGEQSGAPTWSSNLPGVERSGVSDGGWGRSAMDRILGPGSSSRVGADALARMLQSFATGNESVDEGGSRGVGQGRSRGRAVAGGSSGAGVSKRVTSDWSTEEFALHAHRNRQRQRPRTCGTLLTTTLTTARNPQASYQARMARRRHKTSQLMQLTEGESFLHHAQTTDRTHGVSPPLTVQVTDVLDQMDLLLSSSDGSQHQPPRQGQSSRGWAGGVGSKGGPGAWDGSGHGRVSGGGGGRSRTATAVVEVTGYTQKDAVPLRLKIQWLLEVEGDGGVALLQVSRARVGVTRMGTAAGTGARAEANTRTGTPRAGPPQPGEPLSFAPHSRGAARRVPQPQLLGQRSALGRATRTHSPTWSMPGGGQSAGPCTLLVAICTRRVLQTAATCDSQTTLSAPAAPLVDDRGVVRGAGVDAAGGRHAVTRWVSPVAGRAASESRRDLPAKATHAAPAVRRDKSPNLTPDLRARVPAHGCAGTGPGVQNLTPDSRVRVHDTRANKQMVRYAQGAEATWQDMADMADDFAHYFTTATVGSYLGVSVCGTHQGASSSPNVTVRSAAAAAARPDPACSHPFTWAVCVPPIPPPHPPTPTPPHSTHTHTHTQLLPSKLGLPKPSEWREQLSPQEGNRLRWMVKQLVMRVAARADNVEPRVIATSLFCMAQLQIHPPAYYTRLLEGLTPHLTGRIPRVPTPLTHPNLTTHTSVSSGRSGRSGGGGSGSAEGVSFSQPFAAHHTSWLLGTHPYSVCSGSESDSDADPNPQQPAACSSSSSAHSSSGVVGTPASRPPLFSTTSSRKHSSTSSSASSSSSRFAGTSPPGGGQAESVRLVAAVGVGVAAVGEETAATAAAAAAAAQLDRATAPALSAGGALMPDATATDVSMTLWALQEVGHREFPRGFTLSVVRHLTPSLLPTLPMAEAVHIPMDMAAIHMDPGAAWLQEGVSASALPSIPGGTPPQALELLLRFQGMNHHPGPAFVRAVTELACLQNHQLRDSDCVHACEMLALMGHWPGWANLRELIGRWTSLIPATTPARTARFSVALCRVLLLQPALSPASPPGHPPSDAPHAGPASINAALVSQRHTQTKKPSTSSASSRARFASRLRSDRDTGGAADPSGSSSRSTETSDDSSDGSSSERASDDSDDGGSKASGGGSVAAAAVGAAAAARRLGGRRRRTGCGSSVT
ncbi:MAG: hypothetical protein WDW38_011485 [Sanguina aurantia]